MRTTAAAVTLLLCAVGAEAQPPGKWPPDSLVNVRVIPKGTPVLQVSGAMRNIAFALDVECTFCHVGRDGAPLSDIDFASDEKRNKLVAREMMRMVQEVNRRIDSIPARPTPAVTVTCVTCHRGVSRPVPLATIIAEAASAGGADSAIRVYRSLRERYYGQDAYDFSEFSLNATAFLTGRAGKIDDALALLRLNEELFPKASALYITRGNITLGAPFSNNRIDPALFNPASLAIARQLPTTSDPCGRVGVTNPRNIKEHQAIGKVDFQVNQNLFYALASSDSLHTFVVRLIEPVERIIIEHPTLGATLFIVFSALSAMVAFFSTALITPVAIETWGEIPSIALLWIGWMVGGACAYGIGRSLGRPVVRALTSPDALERFEHHISSRAPFGLVLLFQLAMPSEVPGYVLGVARYRFVNPLLQPYVAMRGISEGVVHVNELQPGR